MLKKVSRNVFKSIKK